MSLSDGLAFEAVTPHFRLEVPGLRRGHTTTFEGDDEGEGGGGGEGEGEGEGVSGVALMNVKEPTLESTHDVHHYCFLLAEDTEEVGPLISDPLDSSDPSSDSSDASDASTDASYSVQATLVWTDAPTSPAASRYLASDLDLVVATGRAGRFTSPVAEGPSAAPTPLPTSSGDGGGDGSDANWKPLTVLGNNDPEAWPQWPDAINNAEKVALPASSVRLMPRGQEDELRVSVVGTALPYGPQTYALVVTGGVRSVPCGEHEGPASEGGADHGRHGDSEAGSHFGTFVGYLVAALAIPAAAIVICRMCWSQSRQTGSRDGQPSITLPSSSFQTPRRPRNKQERYQSLNTDNDEEDEEGEGLAGQERDADRGGQLSDAQPSDALASRAREGTGGVQIEMV